MLVALYAASDNAGRWLNAIDEDPALQGDDDQGPWYPVSMFHLVEADHAKRFTYATKREMKLREREFKRSRRVPYRRALRTLEVRGLAQARLERLELDVLMGGRKDPRSRAPAVREVWVARLTPQGKAWVQDNAIEEVDAMGARMRKTAELFDPSRRWLLPPHRPPGRHRGPLVTAAAQQPHTDDGLMDRADVVVLLNDDGFTTRDVEAVLRAWHREVQRDQRRENGDPGPSLDEYVFGLAEVEELRRRLTEPT